MSLLELDKLIEKINKLKCPIVVGLDTDMKFIPKFIKNKAISNFNNTVQAAASAILNFNKIIIDEICDVVPAVKLQCAFYELLGHFGVFALQQTIKYAKNKNLFTIVDGKKNDIANSMKAYSSAYLGQCELPNGEKFSAFDCDALTINPFLGTDSIDPIFEDCKKFQKSAFVLVKTSNPSSIQLQNVKLENGDLLYEHIAKTCCNFNDFEDSKFGYSRIGAVVGATHPNELKNLRLKLPHTFFLVPGFGAQGADLQNLKLAFTKNFSGAIVNSSRAILGAWQNCDCDETEFAKKAKNAAEKMRDEIMTILD